MTDADDRKLRVATPSDRQLSLIRTFDAPRAMVFECMTTPELLRQWLLGPPDWSMPTCEIDLRVGGAYRYEWRHGRDGAVMGMGGFYRKIVPNERIVATELFDEAWYPGEALVTITFVERAGKTTMTTTVMYETPEGRDIALNSQMEQGVAASYDRLDRVLAARRLAAVAGGEC